MSAKHTPGPWNVYEFDPLVIVDANGSSLGDMSAGDPYISHATQLANARLAALAPELLDLVKNLVGITPHRTLDTAAPLYRQMCAAVAKALGEDK